VDDEVEAAGQQRARSQPDRAEVLIEGSLRAGRIIVLGGLGDDVVCVLVEPDRSTDQLLLADVVGEEDEFLQANVGGSEAAAGLAVEIRSGMCSASPRPLRIQAAATSRP
jgi:hypothetical protein